jgi:hypothetical protein
MKTRRKNTRKQERSEDQLGFPAPWIAVKIAAAGCLAVAALAGGVVLYLDRDTGVSAPAAIRTTAVAQGVVLAEPYPMVIEQSTKGPPRVTFLKDSGSGDATRKVQELDGETVRVAGRRLASGPRPLIEVFDASSIAPAESFDSVVSAAAKRQKLGSTVVTGELSTSHTQGDPAMLASPDGAGGIRYYLLASEGGGRLDPAVLSALRGVVEASGRLERVGDLWILRVDPRNIRAGVMHPD